MLENENISTSGMSWNVHCASCTKVWLGSHDAEEILLDAALHHWAVFIGMNGHHVLTRCPFLYGSMVSVGSLCSEITHKNKWYFQPLKTKIDSIPTNHPQGVGVVGFCAAMMIVFTECTNHRREGFVWLRSCFRYQQKWRHPTSLIQPSRIGGVADLLFFRISPSFWITWWKFHAKNSYLKALLHR